MNQASVPISANPLVSVIIPVYDDADRLRICLNCLQAQTYGRAEIVVVDNGSADLAAVQAVVDACPNATLVREPTPGSYAARNRGIATATGEILAFTDADCIPAADWLAQGVRHLQENPGCGLVAGAIDIVPSNLAHPVELYDSVMGLRQQKFVEQDRFGATANVFTQPCIFEQVGLFDAQLKSSGDVEWGQRVFAAGYRQLYAEAARVQHPARSSFGQLSRQASRHAGGFYALQCQQSTSAVRQNLTFLKLLGFHLMPPVRFAWQTARHPQLETWAQKAKVVLVLSFVRLAIVKSLLQLKFGAVAERQ